MPPFFIMDTDDYWIPRNLDAPPLFFIWETDTALIWIVWLFMGALLNMFFLGLFFAIIFGRGYARLKEEGGAGLITKIMYWYTPSELWLSKRLPSHIREYLG